MKNASVYLLERGIGAFLLLMWSLAGRAGAQGVPYQVAQSYEDSVRIVLIWTTTGMQDVCPSLPEAGQEALAFTQQSLASINQANIRVFQSTSVTLQQVQNAFGNLKPHVVVHINGGWASRSGGSITQIMEWAVANYVGWVEIGDDAAFLTSRVFEWAYYSVGFGGNLPAPMYTAEWLNKANDSLWIRTEPTRDTLVDSTLYPFLTGIVINAIRKVQRGNPRLFFNPYPSGRCEADPDSFIFQPGKITFLGYQQGWNATIDGTDGTWLYASAPVSQGLVGLRDQFINIAAFQDSMRYPTGVVVRRAVALSYQPQYLQNTVASQQVVYDAIMFASLAHTLQPIGVQIRVANDTIIAGQWATLSAIILPENLDPAIKQQLAQTVRWQLPPTQKRPGDSLSGNVGPSVQVTGTEAYRFITVNATLYDPTFNDTVRATARIYVKPGPDYKVWIEKTSRTPLTQESQVLPTTHADSVTPRPIDLITLDSAQNTAYAYAVVRDRYGNIKRVASFASWQDLPPLGPVSVSGTVGKLWEGVITRTGSGADSIRAWEAMPTVLLGDTVVVVLQAGTLTALRVVDENGNVVTAVNINTDQVQYFRVQGQWSDKPGVWVDFPAQWSMSPQIASANAMPTTDATNWTFSPTVPGSGTLRVSNASGSRFVEIPVTVTPAAPSRVEIRLVDNNPTAGVPFRVEVLIYNTDGLVPGRWCYPGDGRGQVVYQDILMRVGQYPLVSTDYDFDTLNLRPDTTHRVSECFVDGRDTVLVTLFYAPQSADSSHQLWVRMYGATGYIEGSTLPFRLLPGPVARIYLVDGQGNLLPGSLSLSAPTGILYALSMGVDAYGNLIGAVQSRWEGGGSLHSVPGGPSPSLYYTTRDVTGAESGCIVATAVDNSGARDTICLTITAPPAYVTKAVTRDTSGNGYLDRIEVYFSKVVTIGEAVSLTSVVVTYHGRTVDYVFEVGDIVSVSGGDRDSVFYIELVELRNGIPQTGWLPTVRFVGVEDVLGTEVVCIDGAGPVIWSVVKEVKDVDDHTKDIVTVTFSEPLDRVPGANDVPGVVFEVWTRNADGSFSDADTLLFGIDFFHISSKDDVAKFQMVNGQNLTGSNYLSIRVKDPPVVVDGTVGGNAPGENNQRVQVQVSSAMVVKAAPNPMVPTGLRANDDRLRYRDPEQVAQWAYQDNGTAFMVAIPLPGDSMMTLEGELLVYDVAGNLVHYRPSGGPIDLSQWRSRWSEVSGKTQYFGVYWNGLNDQGMHCSPGVYRAIVKLRSTYQFQGKRTSKRLDQVVAIGVKK